MTTYVHVIYHMHCIHYIMVELFIFENVFLYKYQFKYLLYRNIELYIVCIIKYINIFLLYIVCCIYKIDDVCL